MLTATLRGMLAHKLRLVLTTASIALGVAFLAGTLVLTDTMGLAFEQLFGKVSAGTDAVVRTEAAYTAVRRASAPAARPIAASVLDEVRRRRRRPRRRGLGQRLRAAHRQRRQGHPHQRRRADHGLQHGRPTRSSAATSSCSPATAPDEPDEVAIDATSAEEQRHRARLDDQGAVPGPDPGVHRRRHRRLRRREGPRRHHVGVLRHRDRAEGPRRRPACSTRST